MKFTDFELVPEVVQVLEGKSFFEPTSVQRAVIPLALKGHDMIVGADTGSGKTLSFLLPTINSHIASRRDRNLTSEEPEQIRCLILCPTRELAFQVVKNMEMFGDKGLVRVALVTGGKEYKQQHAILFQGVDFVVATPGRLLELIDLKSIDLSQVQTLVLDEADRMLDMGFKRDVTTIIRHIPTKANTLLFSATLDDSVFNFSKKTLKSPKVVELKSRLATRVEVEQRVYLVDSSRKLALLSHLLQRNEWKQVLIFLRSKQDADRIVEKLGTNALACSALHGDKPQKEREATMAAFKRGELRVLVATDIAARGLHVDDLPCVINYQLPFKSEDYVHRVGRTGRAGNKGLAISLVTEQDERQLSAIETAIDERLLQQWYPGFEPDLSNSPLSSNEIKNKNGRRKREASKRRRGRL